MKIRLKMKEPEESEHDIYTEQGISQKAEDDEISSSEEAFMRGYCMRCD